MKRENRDFAPVRIDGSKKRRHGHSKHIPLGKPLCASPPIGVNMLKTAALRRASFVWSRSDVTRERRLSAKSLRQLDLQDAQWPYLLHRAVRQIRDSMLIVDSKVVSFGASR